MYGHGQGAPKLKILILNLTLTLFITLTTILTLILILIHEFSCARNEATEIQSIVTLYVTGHRIDKEIIGGLSDLGCHAGPPILLPTKMEKLNKQQH